MKRVWAIAFCMLLFWACSSLNTSGTTSETENKFAMRVAGADGSPAAFAKIYLVDASHFDSLVNAGVNPVADSLYADSNGRLELVPEKFKGQKWNLLIYASGDAALLRNVEIRGADTTVALQKAGMLKGHTDLSAGTRLVLDGSGISAEVDSSGNFEFSGIPQGNFAIFRTLAPAGESALIASVAVSGDTVVRTANAPEGLLLDDFEAGNGKLAISSLGAGGSWYLYTEGKGTSFAPAGVNSDFPLALADTGAYDGVSVAISIALDSNPVTPYGALACALGPDSGARNVDLSSLDSVSLRVRGSGQVRLFFASEYVHTNYPEESGADLGYTFLLPSEWTRIVIPRDSLLPPPTSSAAADSVRWPQVSGSVSLIGIGTWAKAGETIHLQVDDIRIYGVPYTQFR
jgi:hypothetical protein